MSELTEKEISLIKSAFSYDATPQEVALETGIDYEKILEWLAIEENINFVEIIRHQPKWAAKKLVTMAAQEDVKVAQWYLERKMKDEFSSRNELTGANGKDLLPKPLLLNVRGDNSLEESNGDEE